MHKICWQEVSFKIKTLKMFIHQSGDNEINSRGGFTPTQVHWNCLGLHMCNSLVTETIRATWTCRLARPCRPDGLSWNLADAVTQQQVGRFTPSQVHLGPSWPVDVQCHDYLPMGVIRASTGHWKSRTSSLEVCWPVDVHRHGHLPIGTTCACPWA